MVSHVDYPVMHQHNVRNDTTEVETQLLQVRGIHLAALPRSLATDRPGTLGITQQAAGSKRSADKTNYICCRILQ